MCLEVTEFGIQKKRFEAYNISAEVLWVSRIWEQLSHNPSMVNRRHTIMRLDWNIYLQSKDNSKIIPRRLVKTAVVVTMKECDKQSLIDTLN